MGAGRQLESTHTVHHTTPEWWSESWTKNRGSGDKGDCPILERPAKTLGKVTSEPRSNEVSAGSLRRFLTREGKSSIPGG